MTLSEAIERGAQSAVSWVVVGTLGGIGYLVRRVFTNQKQIDALTAALERRDEQRLRDMEEFRGSVKRIEETQREMRDDIKTLFRRDG